MNTEPPSFQEQVEAGEKRSRQALELRVAQIGLQQRIITQENLNEITRNLEVTHIIKSGSVLREIDTDPDSLDALAKIIRDRYNLRALRARSRKEAEPEDPFILAVNEVARVANLDQSQSQNLLDMVTQYRDQLGSARVASPVRHNPTVLDPSSASTMSLNRFASVSSPMPPTTRLAPVPNDADTTILSANSPLEQIARRLSLMLPDDFQGKQRIIINNETFRNAVADYATDHVDEIFASSSENTRAGDFITQLNIDFGFGEGYGAAVVRLARRVAAAVILLGGNAEAAVIAAGRVYGLRSNMPLTYPETRKQIARSMGRQAVDKFNGRGYSVMKIYTLLNAGNINLPDSYPNENLVVSEYLGRVFEL